MCDYIYPITYVFFFLVIANQPQTLPYLDALLPKEEDLENGEQDESSVQKQIKKQEAPKLKEQEQIEKAEKAEEMPVNPEDAAKFSSK